MDFDQLFQGARVIAHAITFLVVASFCPSPDSAKRRGISALAIILAGGSSCMAISTVLSWDAWLRLPLPGNIALTLIFSALLFPLLAGRGNVAVLFPRKTWSHRH